MRIKSHLYLYGLATLAGSLLMAGCLPNPATVQSNHLYTMSLESKMGAHPHDTFLEFKSQPAQIVAGQQSIWLLKVLKDKSKELIKAIQAQDDAKAKEARKPEPVKDFAVVHEKLMHLIVVSKDLSWLNHIHPEYKDNGLFLTTVVLPRPGSYKLYADYTPLNGHQEVPQSEFTALVGGTAVAGANAAMPAAQAAAPVSLIADNARPGIVTRQIESKPESQPDTPGGATYHVQWLAPARLNAGQSVLLHFQVRDANDQPVNDLQPYLGAMGHAILLSADTNIYLHTHPLANDQVAQLLTAESGKAPTLSRADVFFPVLFPKAGLYKIWAQFQHQDRIITAPFVIKVGEKLASTTTSAVGTLYVCPMHPEVTSKEPNQTCPKCGMPLIKKT